MDRLTTAQEEELLNYLDGKLNDIQVRALKAALEVSPLLANRLEELRAIHTALSSQNRLEAPSSNFTHRVMANLHRYHEITRLSPKTGLFLLFGIMVAASILTFLISSGVFDGMSMPIALDKIPTPKPVFDAPVSFSGKWVMNGLVILNLVIGFIILDRTVLRPYFGRRAKLDL